MAQIHACVKPEQIQRVWIERKLSKQNENSVPGAFKFGSNLSSALAFSNDLSHNLSHHFQIMSVCIRHSCR